MVTISQVKDMDWQNLQQTQKYSAYKEHTYFKKKLADHKSNDVKQYCILQKSGRKSMNNYPNFTQHGFQSRTN